MAEVDTSTYPRAAPPQQQNPLDQIGKLQEMGLKQQQSQKNVIGIDQEKLKLVNQKWDYASKVLGSLINKPDLKSEDFIDASQHLVNTGVKTPEQSAKFLSEIPTLAEVKRNNPGATPEQAKALHQQKLRDMGKYTLMQGASTMEQLNGAYGVPGPVVNTGQSAYPTIYNQSKGTILPTDQSFPMEQPPTQVETTQNGQQYRGTQPAPLPPRRPANGLPIDQTVNPRTVNGQPQNLTGPVIAPRTTPGPVGGTASQPPAFEEGKKQYAEDIAQASRTLQGVKPAQQALKLMDPEVIKGLSGTGPIAEKASKILGALQGVGILETTTPVAQRQELVKKLAYYLKNSPSGQRSDAAQELATKASANPDVQLLPALINITRDNVALDRVDAAKSLAFEDKDYSKYLPHKGGFPNSIDERAFKLDLMPPDEREKLREKIKKENKSNQEKFLRSYGLAKKLNMFGE